MIFGYAKMAITLVMIIGIGGALTYVFKLRADNAVLKANNLVLEQSVESQKMVIEQQKKDFFFQIFNDRSIINRLDNSTAE